MQRALAEVVLIALAGGALGCWVVLYGFSYAAESLAHSIFPGLVLAALAGVPLLLGAAPAIALAALAIALAGRVPGVSRDAAVAVVVTTMFGLGVLLALSPDSPPGIESLLFGDILGPSDADLIAAAALAALVAAGAGLLHGRLLATGFDRAAARSLGLAPAAVDAALLVLLVGGDRRRRAGPRQPARRRRLRRPGRGRPPAQRPHPADDRARRRDRPARRRRRPLPLLLRGHRRRRLDRAGDRRRLPARAGPGAGRWAAPGAGLRSADAR